MEKYSNYFLKNILKILSGGVKANGEVSIDGVAMPRVEKSNYLGSIIQEK